MITLILSAISGPVLAEKCETTINSTDKMVFDKSSISVPASCKTFRVNLLHSGKMGKDIMGHNWVLTTQKNASAVAAAGMTAGIENHYLQPQESRVIAATKLIGGGLQSSVNIDVAELSTDTEYQFFCSFPGHISMMIGTLTID
ncbi:azurin [Salinimonas marina]|uniref:Azurin n=1 Tax=Salinimonas marina TaxID=2785918 RepID=A0A7S9DY47_9ALTE|nr:azurin [Salinimonas marina]QPG05748.1 azurin [Salinimonas marina]